MGLNQSTVGTWKNNSLINLHLLTGQIGKPGAGPFSLTGQPNAMGGREAGLLAHQLPGYRVVEDAEHRRQLEAFWHQPAGSIQPADGPDRSRDVPRPGKGPAQGHLDRGDQSGGQPARPAPGSPGAWLGAELVVVAGRLPSDRDNAAGGRCAARGPVGREGMDQHQQRTPGQLQPAAVRSAGRGAARLADPRAVRSLWGFEGFDYRCDAEVWDEFRRLTTGRPCDMTGMTAERLRGSGTFIGPAPTKIITGTPRR